MTYYTTTSPRGSVVVIRLHGTEMTSFTDNPHNSDWIAFQRWLADGNTPEPWPPVE